MVKLKRKKIDGKWFELAKTFHTYMDATDRADHMRTLGYNVRIHQIPVVPVTGRSYINFEVWVKKKTKRRRRK